MTKNDAIHFSDIRRHLVVCKASIVSHAEVMEGEEEKEFLSDLITAVGLLVMQVDAKITKEPV